MIVLSIWSRWPNAATSIKWFFFSAADDTGVADDRPTTINTMLGSGSDQPDPVDRPAKKKKLYLYETLPFADDDWWRGLEMLNVSKCLIWTSRKIEQVQNNFWASPKNVSDVQKCVWTPEKAFKISKKSFESPTTCLGIKKIVSGWLQWQWQWWWRELGR